jgi:drug/metabolite transporter (DMT)-like permease
MGASPKPRELLQQAATDDEQATLLQRNEGDSAAAAAPAGDSSIYSPAGPAPAAAEAKAAAGNSGTRRQQQRRGFVLCTLGGTLWGGGALFAKLMDDPTVGIAEYLVFRTGTISLWLFAISLSQPAARGTLLRLRSEPWALGWPGLVGGSCNAVGMAAFVVSLSFITAANTLCIQAAAPFSAAFLERLIFGTRLSRSMQFCMAVAASGVLVIGGEGLVLQESNSSTDRTAFFIGNVCALICAICSSINSCCLVSLKAIPGAGSVSSMAGTITVMLCSLLFCALDPDVGGVWFNITVHNMLLSVCVGTSIGIGIVFYNCGAVYVTAAQMQLLAMAEVVSGIFFVLVCTHWQCGCGCCTRSRSRFLAAFTASRYYSWAHVLKPHAYG